MENDVDGSEDNASVGTLEGKQLSNSTSHEKDVAKEDTSIKNDDPISTFITPFLVSSDERNETCKMLIEKIKEVLRETKVHVHGSYVQGTAFNTQSLFPSDLDVDIEIGEISSDEKLHEIREYLREERMLSLFKTRILKVKRDRCMICGKTPHSNALPISCPLVYKDGHGISKKDRTCLSAVWTMCKLLDTHEELHVVNVVNPRGVHVFQSRWDLSKKKLNVDFCMGQGK